MLAVAVAADGGRSRSAWVGHLRSHGTRRPTASGVGPAT